MKIEKEKKGRTKSRKCKKRKLNRNCFIILYNMASLDRQLKKV
jgi:hypothetical protein